MEEGRSLGVDGGGQVTWCGWMRAGHLVWMDEGRSLGAVGGGPDHLVQMKEGRSVCVDGEGQVT